MPRHPAVRRHDSCLLTVCHIANCSGDFCCLQDTDCTAKCAKGAYCMIYPGKHYPYYCHSERCNITAVDEEIAKA